MFKTICLFALLALAISQDPATVAGQVAANPNVAAAVGQVTSDPNVAAVVDQATADPSAVIDQVTADPSAVIDQVTANPTQVTDAVSTVVGGTTVGQVVQDPVGTAQGVVGDVNVDPNSVPTLNSVTVGWGAQSVVVTPQSADPTNSDWLNNGEVLNLERLVTGAADGEWALNWSVEDGDDYALFNNNGELVIFDSTNGQNVYALGINDDIDAEIASGAESIVDGVWNSGEDTINTSDIAPQVNNLVNQVWNNVDVQNFLGQNAQTPIATVIDNVAASPQAAVDVVQSAATTAQDAANQVV